MRLLLIVPLVALVAGGPALAAVTKRAEPPHGTAETVILAPRPGTPLDAVARQLVTQDLAESKRAGEKPLVLTGTAPLGPASDRPALFVQLQSARDCGSAGCSTSVYLWQKGGWAKVLDGVGGKLTLAPHKTRGMTDLITDNVRYAWTGHEYRDTRPPPPPIDLRRRG